MSNIINIRDSLNKIDLRTDNKYDLRNLYESVRLSDAEKKQLAKLLSENYEPKYIYETLNSKLTVPSHNLNEHWTDVYRKFIDISNNGSSESEVERAIDALYAENEGNPDYEMAMEKWLDTPFGDDEWSDTSKPLYVIKDKQGNQLSAPNPDDAELWDRVSAMEMRGRTGLSVVAYTGLDEDTTTDQNNQNNQNGQNNPNQKTIAVVDQNGKEISSTAVNKNDQNAINKAVQDSTKTAEQKKGSVVIKESENGLYPGDGKWDKLTEDEKASYKYDADSGKYFKESLSEGVKSVDGFNAGDTIVANTDVFFSHVQDIEDDEYIMAAVTEGGFIKRDRVVFPKGTIFELIDVVNNYPVVREKSTGVELDFSDLSTDFDLVESLLKTTKSSNNLNENFNYDYVELYCDDCGEEWTDDLGGVDSEDELYELASNETCPECGGHNVHLNHIEVDDYEDDYEDSDDELSDNPSSVENRVYEYDGTKPAKNLIKEITDVQVADGVTAIEAEAFSGCSRLTSINIPNSVTSIGAEAFNNCYSLASVKIPSSVTTIDSFAFWGCRSLESIFIPSSVMSMGSNVFSSCARLTNIYCEAESQPDGWASHGNYSDWNTGCPAEVHWGVKSSTNESLVKNPDPVNGPYSKKDIERDLRDLTNNFKRPDTLKCGFEEEDKYAQEILKKHYSKVDSKKQGEWFVITFSEPKVNESLTEAANGSTDNIIDDMRSAGKLKQFASDLINEVFGDDVAFQVDDNRVVCVLDVADTAFTFVFNAKSVEELENSNDLMKFFSDVYVHDYGNPEDTMKELSKMLDMSSYSESKLTEASRENMMDIDSLILIGGGTDECIKLINSVREEYPGIDNDELADILENMNDDLFAIEWMSVIAYFDEAGWLNEDIDPDFSDEELANIYGGDTKSDTPDGLETPSETERRLSKKNITEDTSSYDYEIEEDDIQSFDEETGNIEIFDDLIDYEEGRIVTIKLDDTIQKYKMISINDDGLVTLDWLESVNESTSLKEYTYDDSHMKVEVVYENEGYKVEYHPMAGQPYWIIDKSEVNPLHPVDTFGDKERAIEWADDYDEEDRLDSTYHDYSADELGRMGVYEGLDESNSNSLSKKQIIKILKDHSIDYEELDDKVIATGYFTAADGEPGEEKVDVTGWTTKKLRDWLGY